MSGEERFGGSRIERRALECFLWKDYYSDTLAENPFHGTAAEVQISITLD
jgi:hypothetical protein